jgi:hypothetical protein
VGEERAFCEELLDLELAPGESERVRVALRRGGWLRLLPRALADSDGFAEEWRLRDASGRIVPARLVERRGVGTRPCPRLAFGAELEIPAAPPAGRYRLEALPQHGPPIVRELTIEPGRTTTLAPAGEQ